MAPEPQPFWASRSSNRKKGRDEMGMTQEELAELKARKAAEAAEKQTDDEKTVVPEGTKD